MNEVAAILLAAGRSRRMGAFKPLLPFGDTTVIESCLEYLRQGGVEHVIVVVGHRVGEIQKRLEHAGVSFAFNPDPDSEMSASIACALPQLHSSTRATLVALTDQPAIPATIVTDLIAQWRRGARLLKPEFQGRGGHPVMVDLSLRAELSNLDPKRGLKALFEKHRDEVFRLPVRSPFVVRDMDTWDDYRVLHQEVFGFVPNLGENNRSEPN